MSRNDLPNEKASNFAARLRETVQTMLGTRGDKLDRVVTLRDLIESGITKLAPGWRPGGAGAVPLLPGPGLPEPEVYEPDLTPPPTPTGFAVDAAISHVFIEHDAPLYPQGHGHLRTRVYGVTVQAGDPLPTFSDAVEISQFSGTVHAHPSNPATTWRLWIKWESVDGVLSASPAGGVNGLAVTTAQDVDALLDALTGQITTSELASSLATPIALINQPTTGIVARLDAQTTIIGTLQTEVAALSGTPDYDAGTPYDVDDIVQYDGGLYRALSTTTGNLPTNTTYWQKIGDYASLGDAVAAHAVQLEDHQTRIVATEAGLVAESGARAVLASTVAANTAAISSEASTRASADAALSTTISTVSAVANAKIKTYNQTAAPTTGMTAGDLWFDSDANNRVYRYSGSAWVETTDPRIASTAAAVTTETTARVAGDNALANQITTLSGTVAGNTAAIATEVSTRASADSAFSTQLSTLTSTVNSNNTTQTAAISTEASTRATQTGELYAQYTIKADVGNLISGYGLASTANNAAPTSAFGVQAGQFFVAPPTVNQATAPTANLFKGFVWRNSTTGLVQYWTGSAWSTTPQTLPFVIQTTPQVINGFTVAPGIYGEAAFFARLVATRGQIGLLAVDDARIASLSADKITAGSIAVGQHIQSTSYTGSGINEWRIEGNGVARFTGVTVSGTVYATAGLIGGITIASNAVRAGQSAYNTGSGFHLGSDGRFSLGNSASNRITFNGTNVDIETPNFSLSNGAARLTGQVVAGGVELGADVGPGTGHSGLSLSGDGFTDIFLKRNDGVRFFRVNAGGTNYIDFDSASGNLNFKSAGFQVVSGTMTINQANVINTLNIAGNSVTVPVSAYTGASVSFFANTTVQSAAIDSGGAPVLVTGVVYLRNTFASPVQASVRVLRNGVTIWSAVLQTGSLGTPAPFSLVDYPGGGVHTYSVQVNRDTTVGGGGDTTASARSLTLLAVKR